MSGTIPPLPKYAFMACCSVKKKHRDNFTFIFETLYQLLSIFMADWLMWVRGEMRNVCGDEVHRLLHLSLKIFGCHVICIGKYIYIACSLL